MDTNKRVDNAILYKIQTLPPEKCKKANRILKKHGKATPKEKPRLLCQLCKMVDVELEWKDGRYTIKGEN